MDIYFDVEGGQSRTHPFTLSFDPEAISLHSVADRVVISVQAQMEPNHRHWRDPQIMDIKPVLLSLNGVVYNPQLFQGSQGIGASLAPIETFPLEFTDDKIRLVNLSFHCSRSYIQLLEEQRTPNASPSSVVSLGIYLWMTMYQHQWSEQRPIPMLRHLKSRSGDGIRISKSHWVDMLSFIEFPQRRFIELPAIKTQKGTELLNPAIEELNQAYVLFAQDRYREAVQRCRQARDKLLGVDKPTWAENHLVPIIGAEKAAMIDENIKALNHMGHAASHGRGLEIDREVASYVIGSLTLTLDYIGRKLQ
jgi:hypothetical protein